MTIAAAVLDFYDDSSKELMTKISSPQGFGDTQVNVLTPEEMSRLPDSDFGLVIFTKRASVLKKYPVNDPGNAWLSAQYFDQTHTKLAFPARFVAAKFIKQACDAYGVPASPRVEAYAARVEPGEAQENVFSEGSESRWMLRKLANQEFLEKQASATEVNALVHMPDEHFALVVQTGDGSVIRKYAMPDGGHVLRAAEYFDKYAMDLAPSHRHRFATSVQNRAEELDVDISGNTMLCKWAGETWSRHVHAHLEQRKSLLPHPEHEGARGILDKLAASIAETTPSDMASALETFDEATGLSKYHDRGLADPYSSTMNKVASSWSAEVDGQTITEADLRKVASTKKLAGYLGDTFTKQFAKNPVEIFESLPSPEKSMIKQVINGEA